MFDALTHPSPTSRTSHRPGTQFGDLLFGVLIAGQVVVAAVLVFGPSLHSTDFITASDVARYFHIAHTPGVPYRDVPVEYPPLLLLLARALGASVYELGARLIVLSLIADLSIAWILDRRFGRRAACLFLLLLLPLLPIALPRFDLVVTALALAALVAAESPRRWVAVAGGGLLLAAIFLKVWPVVLLPILLLRRRKTALVTVAIGGSAGFLAWIWAWGTNGPLDVVSFRGAHGWHVESTAGALVQVLRGGAAHFEQGSWRTVWAPHWIGLASVGGSVLVIAGLYWWSRRTVQSSQTSSYLAATATVAILLGGALLFSPQFLVWLMPFVAIVAIEAAPATAWLLGAAVIVQFIVQAAYPPWRSAEMLPAILYTVRNGLVLAVAVTAIMALRGRARCNRDEPAPITEYSTVP